MVNRVEPLPGQESVWDYPRPPRVEKVQERIRIVSNGITIVDTMNAYRVLETSHPPSYYIPPIDINMEYLIPNSRRSFCEFKGEAAYWSLDVEGSRTINVGWSYHDPNQGYRQIKDYIAFYASKVDEAYVGDERVQAQAGDFYGGWITSNIVGPFKGGAGTFGW